MERVESDIVGGSANTALSREEVAVLYCTKTCERKDVNVSKTFVAKTAKCHARKCLKHFALVELSACGKKYDRATRRGGSAWNSARPW